MIFFAFAFSVLMGVGSLAFAYNQTGYEIFARWLVAFGILWLVTIWRRWSWVSSIGIFVLVAMAGYGLWIDLSPGWMITATLGGLFAWDLTEFMRRLRVAPKSEDLPGLERRHLARLTIVALIGVGLASIAMLVRLEFSFEWVVLLTLIAALGITQLVSWLRRS